MTADPVYTLSIVGAPNEKRDLAADLRAVIERTILAHPRSAQATIGPSEVGTPCGRKLGHKIAGTVPVRPSEAAWRPTVGTAVHEWLHAAFRAENESLGWDRFILEGRVTAGTIGGRPLSGTCDVFDRLTGTVVDWKIPGVTTIRKARAAHSPGETYRTQVHIYGLGHLAAGEAVEHVAIYMLPAAGEIADGWFWTEPFDAQRAADAIMRADGIAAGIAAVGADVIVPQLPMVNDYCTHCPFWQPGATDLMKACTGLVFDREISRARPIAAFIPETAPPQEGAAS